jgi:hypothetical protein
MWKDVFISSALASSCSQFPLYLPPVHTIQLITYSSPLALRFSHFTSYIISYILFTFLVIKDRGFMNSLLRDREIYCRISLSGAIPLMRLLERNNDGEFSLTKDFSTPRLFWTSGLDLTFSGFSHFCTLIFIFYLAAAETSSSLTTVVSVRYQGCEPPSKTLPNCRKSRG